MFPEDFNTDGGMMALLEGVPLVISEFTITHDSNVSQSGISSGRGYKVTTNDVYAVTVRGFGNQHMSIRLSNDQYIFDEKYTIWMNGYIVSNETTNIGGEIQSEIELTVAEYDVWERP